MEKRADALDERLPAGYNPNPSPLGEFFGSGSVFGEASQDAVSGVQRAAGRLYGVCMAQASFTPSAALRGVTPSLLAHIAETIVVHGEVILYIDPRTLELVPVADGFVELGGFARESWQFRLSLPGPSSFTDMLVPQEAVVHIQWGFDPRQPWVSLNPFATSAGQATLRLERSISADGAAPVSAVSERATKHRKPTFRGSGPTHIRA